MPNIKQKIDQYFQESVKRNASDLHLSVGYLPTLRIDGVLVPLENKSIITPETAEYFISELLNKKQKEIFEKRKYCDFSYEVAGEYRFRVNVYLQRGFPSLAARLIPKKIPTLKELNLPEKLAEFTQEAQGLVLVVGPTGHGKSSTLAALIDIINHKFNKHIITIEDPIEYLFTQDQCMIEQRELHQDTASFAEALRSVLREDADVVMLGEMRDLETISSAITVAETGHLVFSTLHTNDAQQTIDRIIDVFPAGQQNQIRAQLANIILGVVSQRLIPRAGGGRVPAIEILKANSAVRNLIREKATHQINSVLETNMNNGMISLNNSLADLVIKNQITLENALLYSTNKEGLRALLEE